MKADFAGRPSADTRKEKTMTNILQSSLAKKVVLLIVLTAALVYLRAPEQVQAQQGTKCMQQCLAQFKACIATCAGNRTCIQNCGEANQECEAGCIP
jgi:hypothetical protein